MKGKIMAENNNGWEKPEEKFPETEFEDSFSGFFSEEEEIGISESGKKRRKPQSLPTEVFVYKRSCSYSAGNHAPFRAGFPVG